MSMAQSLEQTMAKDACDCYDFSSSKKDKDSFMNEFINTCFKMSFFKFKDDIQKTFGISDSTDYSSGYDLGKKIAPKILHYLVMDCDKFYHLFDSLRWSGRENIDRDSVKKDLGTYKELIKERQTNREIYFSRGFAYFQLGKYNRAKEDFKKSIQMDGTFGLPYLYLGLTKELKGDLRGAKVDYQKSLDLTGIQEISLLISIVERKERERNVRQHRV
jgi:tetratricopeptide (TPR) repeat protein